MDAEGAQQSLGTNGSHFDFLPTKGPKKSAVVEPLYFHESMS